MTTLQQWRMGERAEEEQAATGRTTPTDDKPAGQERREHRRHDLEPHAIAVARCDGVRNGKRVLLGQLLDLSAGGARIRTTQDSVQPDQQLRVRIQLPVYAGICPFVDTTGPLPAPKREWVGWMSVSRVQPLGDGQYDVAGRLMDMEELDRGMLGLYLSTQPLAA